MKVSIEMNKQEKSMNVVNVVNVVSRHIKTACDDVKLVKIVELEKTLNCCDSHHAIVDACVRAKITEIELIDMLIKHSKHTRFSINSILQAKARIKRILLSVALSKTENKYIIRSKKRNLKINSFA
jgi:hypothetical protein